MPAAREERLFEQLRLLNAGGGWMAECYQTPPNPYRPATEKQLARAERKLGFPLSALLRSVYTEVGNGGIGFLGIQGGAV